MIFDIENINDIHELKNIKEQIKNQITQADLDWLARIELYRQVQRINEKISELDPLSVSELHR